MPDRQMTILGDRPTVPVAPRQAGDPPPPHLEPLGLPLASRDPGKLTAASYLGVSRATMYRLLAAGELDGFHIGAAAMVTKVSLDAYVERQRAAEARARWPATRPGA